MQLPQGPNREIVNL